MRKRSKRKLSQEAAKEQNRRKTNHKKEEATNTKGKKTTPKPQHNNKQTASRKPLFDTVMGGSDAESRVDRKLSGVPPWETQRECTSELIGSDLLEHEKLGKHP